MDAEYDNPLITGGIYKITARNFTTGVYDGNHGFTGIREKFGSTFLDTEIIWEEPWHGTVKPREHIADLAPWVNLDLYTGAVCITCRHPLADNWRAPDRDHDCGCDCEHVTGMLVANQQLYDALLPFYSDETRQAWARSEKAFSRRHDRMRREEK